MIDEIADLAKNGKRPLVRMIIVLWTALVAVSSAFVSVTAATFINDRSVDEVQDGLQEHMRTEGHSLLTQRANLFENEIRQSLGELKVEVREIRQLLRN